MVTSRFCYLEVICGQGRVGQTLCISVDEKTSSNAQLPSIDLVTSKVDYPRWHGHIKLPVSRSEFRIGIRCSNDEIMWEPLPRRRRWPDALEASAPTAHLKIYFGVPGCLIVDDPENSNVKFASILTAEKAAWDRVAIVEGPFEKAVNERKTVEMVLKDLIEEEKILCRKAIEDLKSAQDVAIKQERAKISVIEQMSPSRPCSITAVTPKQRDNSEKPKLEIETPVKTKVSVACKEEGEEEEQVWERESSPEHAWLCNALRNVPTFLCADSLSRALRNARERLDAERCACVSAWRSPLSAIVANFENDVLAHGVPAWVDAILAKARLLIVETTSLLDLLDVYEREVRIVRDTGAGILGEPLVNIIERCDWQSRCLCAYTGQLQYAHTVCDPSGREALLFQKDGIDNAFPKVKRELPLPARLRELPSSILANSEVCMLSVFCSFVVDTVLDLVEAMCLAMAPDQEE